MNHKDPTRFVLVGTSHAGNVGAAARAMKVMGFAELVLVAHRVAFVFGSERFGLSNDDLYTCHACLSIPTDPRYGSLNLAQAVQLIAYDWRQAQGGFAVEPRASEGAIADATAVRGLIAHWQESLTALGFLDPAAPKK